MNVAGDGPIKLIVNLWKASVAHLLTQRSVKLYTYRWQEVKLSRGVGGHWKEDEGCLNQVHRVMLWVYYILIDARKWPYVTQFSAIKK